MSNDKPGKDPEIRVPPVSDIPPVDDIPDSIDVPYEGPHIVEPPGAGPEDDGDNAYEESDEALPDDAEEKSIDEDPERDERRLGDEEPGK